MAQDDVAAAIEELLRSTHYGDALAAAGLTTVALDENGDLIECRPDGTTRRLPTRG